MNKAERTTKEEFEDIWLKWPKPGFPTASEEGRIMGLKNKSNR